ncbi:MAG: MurR/RpiR family transcriptional regulator [Cellvibrionaceae bacterium]|nr:MurR/RpiR family transcriptional regulator [Cellvibrionaceae bacterium]
MTQKEKPPHDYEGIRRQIETDYGKLSKRLQDIAKFAMEHPTDIALETIATLAKRADVQPSALIRFSKFFGYSGFSEMQRAFHTRVQERSASYKERVRELKVDLEGSEPGLIASLTQQFCNTGIYSLEELREGGNLEKMQLAIELLERAQRIFICGQRRSFPVAAYLAYSLNHADASAILLDGIGGMLGEQARTMRSGDLLCVITYPPYARESAAMIDIALEAGVPILLITDSSFCPHAAAASVCLEVHDAEVHSFKSLTASMCLSQILVTSLAFRNREELNKA